MASKKTGFQKFARQMAAALRLGRQHKTLRYIETSPRALASALGILENNVRSVRMLYLREAYLAGYNFSESD
jgi:hypothetical protein